MKFHHHQFRDLPIGDDPNEEYIIIPKNLFFKDVEGFLKKHLSPFPKEFNPPIKKEILSKVGKIYKFVIEERMAVDRAVKKVGKSTKEIQNLR